MRSLLIGLLMLPFLMGCGGGKVRVTGQVLYNGKPLPGGSVFFRPADPKQNGVSAELDDQGNYEAVLPVGEVQVAVDNRELQPRPTASTGAALNLPPQLREALNKAKTSEPPPTPPKAENTSAASKPRGKYVAIPEKYYTIDTSGLTFKVESGNPKHDIELK